MLQSVVQPLVRRVTDRGGQSPIQRAIASLRARGTDAHLWLPGVGTVSGLTTGNYLESTGNSVATVNNPCGLVLDALGTVGSELVTNGGFDTDTGWIAAAATSSIIDGKLKTTNNGSGFGTTYQVISDLVVGKVYRVSAFADTNLGGLCGAILRLVGAPSDATLSVGSAGTLTLFFVAASTSQNLQLINGSNVAGRYVHWDNASIREVTGIHLTQATTANKGLLKQDAGSRYYWLFDATDLLTGTFPAGYESVTVIDAKSTGQVTTSAANVVGSYSIGPSYSSYGRIIIKGSITASELALYQGFANRLAGL